MALQTSTVVLDGESLSLSGLVAVADGAPAALDGAASARMARARAVIDEIVVRGDVVYGVNTGFGALADVRIAAGEVRRLQLNLVRSHACGVREPLPARTVRAMMALRANVLAKGYSGCRPLIAETLVAMLNGGVHPIIPSRGSVGASGDLAPLAHLALVLIGEGAAEYCGEMLPGRQALRRAGIVPVVLEAKEGLALLNGTQGMCGCGGLAVAAAQALANAADITGALTLDALRGTPAAFSALIQQVRPFAGQAESAERLRFLIEKSEIRESHRDPLLDPRVQDAYSVRCMPQVHGAVRDALRHVKWLLEIEINSATDNPLVFPDSGEVLSGGNFHGEPVALALDYAAIAVAELGTISERRVERLVNPALSGLPAFLSPEPGMNSGLMMAQITAASLIAENSVLAHPASIASLPTSANREDHVSMGMTAALKLDQVVRNTDYILAIELMASCQALEFLKPLRPGPTLHRVYTVVRERVPSLQADVALSDYIEALVPVVREIGQWPLQ